jgi:hypothetical protein
MTAANVNLVIEKNSDFEVIFTIDNLETGAALNLNNRTLESKFKKNYQSSSGTSFQVEVIDGPKGKVKLSLPYSTCSGLTARRYVYDLVSIDHTTGTKERLVEGIITVLEKVTSSTSSGITGQSLGQQTSYNRICIAVIDENSNTSVDGMEALWNQFRENWPKRRFFLLQPGQYSNSIDDLAVPPTFLEQTDPDTISYP